MSREGLLFIVSAPSGAGKTTLCKELAGYLPDISHAISHTTRSARPTEKEGEHYYFVSDTEFKKLAEDGGFVEYATVHGHLYGTSKKELDRIFGQGKDVILDIDTQGAMQIRQSGIKGVFIFILPPSMDELERRLRGRDSDDEAEIARRLKRAMEELDSFDRYDYIIINDNLGKALEALRSVILAERCRLANVDAAATRKKFGLA